MVDCTLDEVDTDEGGVDKDGLDSEKPERKRNSEPGNSSNTVKVKTEKEEEESDIGRDSEEVKEEKMDVDGEESGTEVKKEPGESLKKESDEENDLTDVSVLCSQRLRDRFSISTDSETKICSVNFPFYIYT